MITSTTTSIDWTLIHQLIFSIACVAGAVLIANIWIGRNKNTDGVSSESEAVYFEKDILGQSKNWKEREKDESKNDLPGMSKPSIVILIAAMILAWIIFRVGLTL